MSLDHRPISRTNVDEAVKNRPHSYISLRISYMTSTRIFHITRLCFPLLFYSSVAFTLGTIITDGLSRLLFVCMHEIWNKVDLRIFICAHALHCFKTHGGFSLTIAFRFLWRIALVSMESGVDFNESCFKMELLANQRHQYLLMAHFRAWNEDGLISVTADDLLCLHSSNGPTIKASDAYR
jgi:hypothetical protein